MRARGQGLVFAICFSGVHAEKTGPQKDRCEYHVSTVREYRVSTV